MPNLEVSDHDSGGCSASLASIKGWLGDIIKAYGKPVDYDISAALLSNQSMAQVNHDFCGKRKPTNALAFPADKAERRSGEVGEILVAPQVIEQEANTGNIALQDHWAHVLVHAFLHLEGYDHGSHKEASAMFSMERSVITSLGFADPHPELADMRGMKGHGIAV